MDKTIIGVIAIILAIVAYIPYIRDTLKKKTTPHIFSFFVWGFATLIIFALQVKGGAGAGSWGTICVALICLFIFCLGLRNGKKDITRSDIIFFLLSLIALFLWLITDQPILATILIVSVDLLAFVPTIHKSWHKPHSETLSLYAVSTFRHGLEIFALQNLNVLTLLNPSVWTIANGLFAIFLIFRRKQISK